MKKHRHTINVLLIIFLLMMMGYLLVYFIWTGNGLEIRHCISIFFTTITLISLFINHNIFTLLLGVTLCIGNFVGLSSFHEITKAYFGFNIGSVFIPLYWGQPEYSVLLFIHLIFNKEFYLGIGTKEYWQNFLYRTKDLEQVVIPPRNK